MLCKQRDILTWYRAVDRSGGNDVLAQDISSFMRVWYNEMEWALLTADIVIPDRGQDRLETAQAWVEQYEGAALQVTRGSTYAYSYFRAADVHLSDTVTEEDGAWDLPAPITDEPWFLFWYTGIFAPENQEAMRRSYAGNTGDYGGAYGEAPEGALSYRRCGYMYLTEKGWRCGAVGTGP